jgi:hypothetical protein
VDGDSTGIALDSSGNVYASDPVNSQIDKFYSNGTFITAINTIIPKTDIHGNLLYTCKPSGIAFDSLDNIYVTNPDNHSIEKFDSTGIYISSICAPTSMPIQGIAVDSFGNVFVADFPNGWVYKFDASGNSLN